MQDRYTVLVVDDEIESLRALERTLRRHYTVHKATEGEVALEILRREEIDLILVDQRMPGMTGVQFLEKARAVRPRAVRMVITAYTETNDIISSINKGKIYHFFTKPWDPDHLRITVQRALEDYALARENERLLGKLQSANRKLHDEYRRDSLTGLLNRRGLEEFLQEELDRTRRLGTNLSAFILDLNDFKLVNDTFGLAVGDVVLNEIGRVLRDSLRGGDHICRVGGDEFLALLPGTSIEEAEAVVRRVLINLRKQVLTCSDRTLSVSGTVGVARILPEEVSTIEELLALTWVSLMENKARKGITGRSAPRGPRSAGSVKPSEPDPRQEKVLQGEGFYTLVQPIVELETMAVVGYEMLIRTTLPGLETPEALFQFAIRHNILNAVDFRCLRFCIEEATKWQLPGNWNVNLFPSTLVAIPSERLVQLLCRDTPGTVCVELSEQQFIGEPNYLREPVNALREKGISLAVDDLGFGRSSFESLVVLEPEIIKIDRQYVQGIAGSPIKRRDLERTHALLESLQAVQVAEGIEEEEDLEELRRIGIPQGQGYFLGRPGPLENVCESRCASPVTSQTVPAK